jgi:hypothetical protein
MESEVLARIQADFHTMIRGSAQAGTTMAITCFYEELPVLRVVAVSPKTFSNSVMKWLMVLRALTYSFRLGDRKPKSSFYVPYDRHSNFVGCKDILQELAERLETTNCVALAGIGGVGEAASSIYHLNQTNMNAESLKLRSSIVIGSTKNIQMQRFSGSLQIPFPNSSRLISPSLRKCTCQK